MIGVVRFAVPPSPADKLAIALVVEPDRSRPLPPGQREAATALGLRYYNRMRYVLLPQALKIALAPTVGFLVQLIKGTSLASIIGFVELTRAAQIINNATFRPFTIFALVALVYYVICRPLSAYSKRMEQKLLVAAR